MVDEPEFPKHPPRNVDTNKWCEYHHTVGHDTDDCFTLKKEIEKLIKAEHLRQYVQRNDVNTILLLKHEERSVYRGREWTVNLEKRNRCNE